MSFFLPNMSKAPGSLTCIEPAYSVDPPVRTTKSVHLAHFFFYVVVSCFAWSCPARSINQLNTPLPFQARLDEAINPGTSNHTDIIDVLESCDRAVAIAASALSFVMGSPLSDFPAHTYRRIGDGEITVGSGSTYPLSPSEPGGTSTRRGFHASPLVAAAVAAASGPAPEGGRNQRLRSAGLRVPPTAVASGGGGVGAFGSMMVDEGATAMTASVTATTATTTTKTTRRRSSVLSVGSAPSPAAAQMAASLGLAPVTREGIIKRHAKATAAIEERRRAMGIPTVSGGGRGGLNLGQGSRLAGVTRAREPNTGSAGEEPEGARNSKLSPGEQQYVESLAAMTGGSVVLRTRRSWSGGGLDGSTAAATGGAPVSRNGRTAVTAAAAVGPEPNRRISRARPLAPGAARVGSQGHTDTLMGAATRSAQDSRQAVGRRHLAAADNRAVQEAIDDQMSQAMFSDARFAATFFNSPRGSPRRATGAARARWRSLVRLQRRGNGAGSRSGSGSGSTSPPPPQNAARFLRGAASRMVDDDEIPPVDEDEVRRVLRFLTGFSPPPPPRLIRLKVERCMYVLRFFCI